MGVGITFPIMKCIILNIFKITDLLRSFKPITVIYNALKMYGCVKLLDKRRVWIQVQFGITWLASLLETLLT